MEVKVLGWLKQNLRTRRDWGVALTAFTPLALVVGRAPADWAVSIVAILFLFDSIVRRQWTWAKQAWVAAALLLWAYSVIRAAFIQGDEGDGLLAAFVWLRYIVFAASMVEWTLAGEKGRRWLLTASLAAVLFLSVDGLIQYVFGEDILGHKLYGSDRLTGPYKRPTLGMTIANLFTPVIFWFLSRKQNLFSILLANVCYVTIFLSGDRMGLVFASTVMIVWFFALLCVSKKYILVIVLNICFLTLLFCFSPQVAERQIQSTAATAEALPSSPYGLVWKSAWQVGAAHPLFGVGMRQFRHACTDESYGPVINPRTGDMRCYTHPHNHYMEWFSEAGLVGLLGFIGFVVTIGIGLFRRLLSNEADFVLLGLSAMLGIRLIPFFVTTSFFNNWSAIPFWLALGWAMSYKLSPINFKFPCIFKKA